ncbi:hypothetical protein PR048_016024 [Dryococelus australis]|uniref:Uncharacterized protein n=1 Tax=Dryococelus australis TaxID=614101 RepID=A0ABQ9HIU2_9NEOP|nr:hypothetical protein PR048_016024 [Dryococelus australis]
MQCSVDVCAKEECHKESYRVVSVNLKSFSDYNNENQTILSLRLRKCNLQHESIMRKILSSLWTCDPLKINKKSITKGLKEITLMFATAYSHLVLIPGKGLCSTCFKKIPNDDTSTQNIQEDDSTYMPADEIVDNVNVACEALGVDPVKIQKLSQGRRQQALQSKVQKVPSTFKDKLSSSFAFDIN